MAWKPPALALALAIAAAVAASEPAAAAPLDAAVAHDLSFAGAQLDRTLAEVPPGSYPYETNADGTWSTRSAGWWISGFFPGSLWRMYQATGNPAWRTAAASRQSGLESQKDNTFTHDVGFMVFDSFGNGYKATGDDGYRQVVLTAAGSLATRYSSVVHATRSWDNTSSDSSTDFKVIVDNMMNLELLWWAAKHGGDPSLAAKALDHALTTVREHVRPDGSTYHLVVFDSTNGAVKRRGTVQGYSDSSTWSRGQAWALYGFTMAYRETGDSRMLDTARRVADYYVSHLPADSVPYWDFQAPGIPNEPRDSSAAAIAASGLIELSQLDPDTGRSRRYFGVAQATLGSLSSGAYLAEGTSSRSILLHGTGNKPGGDYDRGLVYGDYFFIEALLRYRALARGAAAPPDFNGDGYADLAAGAPGENARAGAVNVLYGGAGGLPGAGAKQLDQAAGGGTVEVGDRFGDALACGDFNGDGYSDLAVGAPGEDSGAGAVSVLHGSSSGLSTAAPASLTQASAGGASESGDHFGAALAAGDFNADGRADLAVGDPDEDAAGMNDIGYVAVLYGSAGGVGTSGARQFSENTAGGVAHPGERFGAALAAGTFNDDGRADLAVGAPGDDAGGPEAGAVNLLYGTAGGLSSSGARQLSQSFASGQAEAGDHFGAAVAAGGFDADPRTDLAVGAPDEDSAAGGDVGAVNVLYGTAGGIAATGSRQFAQSAAGGAAAAGDRFGAALAAGNFDADGDMDLAAGAPYDDTSGAADAGVVNVLYGTASGLSSSGAKQLSQSFASGASEALDRFGSAIAAGDYNGDGRFDLTAAAPDEDTSAGADAGAVNVLYGAPSGLVATGSKQLGQGSAGGAAKGGDRFGAALR
ncbi:MAG TPA: FG-GAP-like repeat-containing protein [Thermoleophilaceae bacterium]